MPNPWAGLPSAMRMKAGSARATLLTTLLLGRWNRNLSVGWLDDGHSYYYYYYYLHEIRSLYTITIMLSTFNVFSKIKLRRSTKSFRSLHLSHRSDFLFLFLFLKKISISLLIESLCTQGSSWLQNRPKNLTLAQCPGSFFGCNWSKSWCFQVRPVLHVVIFSIFHRFFQKDW